MRMPLIELVSNHEPFDELEEAHTLKTLEFLEHNDVCTSTENQLGHITASAWVLSPNKSETLLTHHRKLNRWLQLGGHVENDASIQEAALREAREESGIEQLSLVSYTVFDIDVHLIPERKNVGAHYHYDLRFLIQAEKTKFTKSVESNQLAWINLAEVAELDNDESVLRMCRKSAL